uniref:Mitochondrial carrier protein n=1 Tax=Strigamia maritima TaxID=126957 RepID=T1J5Q7_STRMM
MTHNEERVHWIKEGAIGLGVGVLYGLTSVCVGHPLDTIKTKMQAQVGYEKTGIIQSFVKIMKKEGVVGLYRGCVPPLLGSGIYRSTQFAVFEAAYTYLDTNMGKTEIPYTAGLQTRVIIGSLLSSTSRALIETPLDYIKIRRQTGQNWQFSRLYTGFGVTWARTIGLMTCYFIIIDTQRRNFNQFFSSPVLGPFFASGIAATTAWLVVWPLEYMKSQVQGSYGQDKSVLERMKFVIKERGGFLGLYRGLAPGVIRSFIANGCSMIVMSHAQKKVTELGLRS